ncbi:MAG: (2Fe-2S)-binding protein [Alphaproteobacteria bacterium]|nr:(2Fe-2S)-binding protein [Alphaproteobacteria bacterium]MCW5738986.1 (2Fe-2S)-binding protein [Alphaproteobacteria bacterium]
MATTGTVQICVNEIVHHREVEARRRLGDFLREDLGLTGTHLPCEHGVCGVCTVLVDGTPRLSCLTLAMQADGTRVVTVEGLAHDPVLAALHKAFQEQHALQCGYCTPGFLIALAALFRRQPDATDEAIRETIDGIICRCTGYLPILQAAISARDKFIAR